MGTFRLDPDLTKSLAVEIRNNALKNNHGNSYGALEYLANKYAEQMQMLDALRIHLQKHRFDSDAEFHMIRMRRRSMFLVPQIGPVK